tara:strand:- start:5453 stop:6223 length:771 start_codon:yes stop_codon:yes gene_type:complete
MNEKPKVQDLIEKIREFNNDYIFHATSVFNEKECNSIIDQFEKLHKQNKTKEGKSRAGVDKIVKNSYDIYEYPDFKGLDRSFHEKIYWNLSYYLHYVGYLGAQFIGISTKDFLNCDKEGILETSKERIASYIRWENICFRKYLANKGGYHFPHHDRGIGSNRMLSSIIYLNSCENGGDTEFPIIGRRYKPVQGNMLIFPSYFTHNHFSHKSKEDRYVAVIHIRETVELKDAIIYNNKGVFTNDKKKANDEGSKNSN